MNRTRQKLWLVAAAALLSGLAAFCCFSMMPPQWEARALLRMEGVGVQALPSVTASAQFSRHIRELTDFEGTLSAVPIPGTCLVTLSVRDDTESHAAAGLDAAQNQLETILRWVGSGTMELVLLPEPEAISTNLDMGACLAAALAGGLLAALTLFPLPKREEPLDLLDVLHRWAGLAKHHLPGLLIFSLLFGCGNFLRVKLTDSPTVSASALVSIGEYHPDTAKTLSATVSGLLASDLMTVEGITAQQIGQSNLFTLTSTGETQSAAEEKLTTALTLWPEISVYATYDLTMQLRQPMQVTPPQSISPVAPWCTGILLGLLLWAGLQFLAALNPLEKIDTAPSEAYNKSQS